VSFKKTILERIRKAPKAPGVYVFYDKKKILYIGKASSLKNRLQSYLKPGDFNPVKGRPRQQASATGTLGHPASNGIKNDRLQENATDLKLIILRSEIEALIEEAKLIKKYNPPYNVLWRDDKTYFYAAITSDKFPRIFVVHKNQLAIGRFPFAAVIGPFTEGRALRLVLRILRRYFPYCTCAKPHFRTCLNAQIGNCFGFCCRKDAEPTAEQVKKYRKNINTIKTFLLGRPLKGLSKYLEPEEKFALEKILAHREFLENFDSSPKTVTYHSLPTTYSIEGYDISHLSGKETVAGMTAWNFSGGKISPRNDFWRKFIIRTAKPSDDPAAMYEAVSRRLNHPEWPYPNLMIIDGGAGQFAAAKKAFLKSDAAGKTKLISFAKPEQMIYGLGEKPVQIGDADDDLKKIIPHVISKTHDFAIRFHRQRRKKDFLKSGDSW